MWWGMTLIMICADDSSVPDRTENGQWKMAKPQAKAAHKVMALTASISIGLNFISIFLPNVALQDSRGLARYRAPHDSCKTSQISCERLVGLFLQSCGVSVSI